MRSCGSQAWFVVALLVAASGASCPTRQPPVGAAPVVFSAPPGIADVLRVVNANGESVRQLQADDVWLSVEGFPALRASVAMERPRRFRLRARFVGMGEVLDLGSNDELFWALIDAPQMASGAPRALYYARHDQYLQSQAREILPIQPDWLIEAFGLTRFDPAGVHEGPWQRAPGQLEFRSRIPTPEGETGRITVVHETYGWILEQHAYDAQGRLAASALASNHRYYPEFGVSLPHRIEIRLPPAGQSFRLDVDAYSINQLRAEPAQLFSMPASSSYPRIDLAAPLPARVPPASLPAVPGPLSSAPAYPATGLRPRYRGYTANWQ